MSLQAIRLGRSAFSAITDTPIYLTAVLTTDGNYGTLTKAGAGYQVTAGKTLYIIGCKGFSTAIVGVLMGYGDTSVNDGATPPTTPIFVDNAFIGMETAFKLIEPQNVLGIIPATKFPFVRVKTTGVTYVTAWGYEV